MGLRDSQRKVVLLFRVNGTGENYRILIDMNTDVAGAERGFRVQTLLNLLLHFRGRQSLRGSLLIRRHLLSRGPFLRKRGWCTLGRWLSLLLGERWHCQEQHQPE